MIELLQEFLFIPLDITKKIYENNSSKKQVGGMAMPEHREGDEYVFKRTNGIR